MKYNEKTSICNVCYQKGWHTEPEPCVRKYSENCEHCGQNLPDREMKTCKGMNVMIDYSKCATKFIPYYENQQRIKVDVIGMGIKSGTVGKTIGWKPVFILMLRSNSTGSSIILTDKDEIL